jgi:hypothetical protein
VSVYVVLRTRVLGESTLEAYLSRLVITLEGRAVGALHVKSADGQNPTQPSQANELLFSEIINTTEEPTICATEVQTEEESEPVQFLYVFWKTKVHLGKLKFITYSLLSSSLQQRQTQSKDTQARHILCSFCILQPSGGCRFRQLRR